MFVSLALAMVVATVVLIFAVVVVSVVAYWQVPPQTNDRTIG